MNPKIISSEIRQLISRNSSKAVEVYDQLYEEASDVLLIGSAATGKLSKSSDIDVLFVGASQRYKKYGVDFISIKETQVKSKSWLGSELATHAAGYGVLMKGDGCWMNNVYFGSASIRIKRVRIAVRLSRIHVQNTFSDADRARFLVKCLMDMQRVVFLMEKHAVPPATILLSNAVSNIDVLYERIRKKDLLGELGDFFVKHLMEPLQVAEAARLVLEERTKTEYSLSSLN